MSYRVKVNGVQIFGNNESYAEWDEFIESQGIEIDEEGCYEGEITDFMAMLQVVEKITLHINDVRMKRAEKANRESKNLSDKEKEIFFSSVWGIKSIFDITNIPEEISKEDKDDKYRTSLFDRLTEYIHHGYAFMPYALYLACEDKLEKDKPFSVDGHFDCFKIKDGEVITVSAS